jgi:hypothetical protein
MPVTGSRQILAPPHRVALALRDPRFLRTMGVAAEPIAADGKDDAAVDVALGAGQAHFALQADRVGTQVAYEVAGAEDPGLKTEIEQLLDRVQSEIAGPAEKGAEGPLVTGAQAIAGGSSLQPLPHLIFGMPLIFWAGTAVFLFIFVMMFSGYL